MEFLRAGSHTLFVSTWSPESNSSEHPKKIKNQSIPLTEQKIRTNCQWRQGTRGWESIGEKNTRIHTQKKSEKGPRGDLERRETFEHFLFTSPGQRRPPPATLFCRQDRFQSGSRQQATAGAPAPGVPCEPSRFHHSSSGRTCLGQKVWR